MNKKFFDYNMKEGKRLNNFYKYDCFSYKMTEMNIKLTVAKSGFGYCSKDGIHIKLNIIKYNII